MGRFTVRFGALPVFLVGVGLLTIGLLALNHLVDNFWPIDVQRIDLVRDTALGRAEATLLLRAANFEIILAFLAVIIVSVTGLTLPLAYFLNKRFGQADSQHFLIVLRQAMWVGLWVSFCTWLQMNRTLGWGVALLAAAVFVILEILLQVRNRVADLAS